MGAYMTKRERLRAIFGNLKNYSFDVNPTYKIDEQDAEVLQEMYAEYLRLRDKEELQQSKWRDYYYSHREKRLADAKERYNRDKLKAMGVDR